MMLMDKILEFFQNGYVLGILVSLDWLLEYWLGKTDMVVPGSKLEIVLSGVKKILEFIGLKKPPANLIK